MKRRATELEKHIRTDQQKQKVKRVVQTVNPMNGLLGWLILCILTGAVLLALITNL